MAYVDCTTCGATGKVDVLEDCATCKGIGTIPSSDYIQQLIGIRNNCPNCQGQKRVKTGQTKTCPQCNGEGKDYVDTSALGKLKAKYEQQSGAHQWEYEIRLIANGEDKQGIISIWVSAGWRLVSSESIPMGGKLGVVAMSDEAFLFRRLKH